MAKRAYKLAVGDLETDPFKHNRPIKPFCAEFYDGEIKHQIWGDDCVKQFVEFVAGLPDPYIIYFHNGGRFDYFLGFLEYFHEDRKSTRLNSSHQIISYAVFCLKKKKKNIMIENNLYV